VAELPPPPLGDDLPAAVPDAPRRVRLPYVWILPAIVIVAGAFVAVHEKIAEGTSIEIEFRTADDLEPNKTKVRYKSVEIGEVKDIRVSGDRKDVIVEAKIHRNASDYLLEDTRFWVVRPRITGTNISGLGTLVSGAYIDVDVGHSSVRRREFMGLEVPPILTFGLRGREYILHAADIGSLTIGSAVFYRHIVAGQVVAYALDPGGESVTVKVFINSPYDAFVTPGVALLAGERRRYVHRLRRRQAAYRVAGVHPRGRRCLPVGRVQRRRRKRPRTRPSPCIPTWSGRCANPTPLRKLSCCISKGSLRGLSVGAPVDLRGIAIGEVKRLAVEYDRVAGELRFPVEVDIFPHAHPRPRALTGPPFGFRRSIRDRRAPDDRQHGRARHARRNQIRQSSHRPEIRLRRCGKRRAPREGGLE
jgi:paraquat-inducible protein B